jgi:hypothetical protein
MTRYEGGDRSRTKTGTETAPAPRVLRRDRRGSVPLRIAPLVIIGLVLLVMAMLAATTL